MDSWMDLKSGRYLPLVEMFACIGRMTVPCVDLSREMRSNSTLWGLLCQQSKPTTRPYNTGVQYSVIQPQFRTPRHQSATASPNVFLRTNSSLNPSLPFPFPPAAVLGLELELEFELELPLAPPTISARPRSERLRLRRCLILGALGLVWPRARPPQIGTQYHAWRSR